MSIALLIGWMAAYGLTFWICGKPLWKGKPQPARVPVIPTRPEKPAFRFTTLTARKNVGSVDEALLRAQSQTVRLAYVLGCDIALRRDGTRNEWLLPGDEPSASVGFILVRNGDA